MVVAVLNTRAGRGDARARAVSRDDRVARSRFGRTSFGCRSPYAIDGQYHALLLLSCSGAGSSCVESLRAPPKKAHSSNTFEMPSSAAISATIFGSSWLRISVMSARLPTNSLLSCRMWWNGSSLNGRISGSDGSARSCEIMRRYEYRNLSSSQPTTTSASSPPRSIATMSAPLSSASAHSVEFSYDQKCPSVITRPQLP